MRKPYNHHRNARLRMFVLLSFYAGVASAQGQTVTWQAWPFPSDSPWGGSKGHLATISSNQVLLEGQSATTVETFSGPLTINLDVLLRPTSSPDGWFRLSFIPLGLASNLNITGSTMFYMTFGSGLQGLTIKQGGAASSTTAWGVVPFSVVAGNTNHLTMNLAANGALSLVVNGQSYSPPSAAWVSLNQFQLEMCGWRPTDTWQVNNFTVVPEPATVALVGVGLVGLLAIVRRRHRV